MAGRRTASRTSMGGGEPDGRVRGNRHGWRSWRSGRRTILRRRTRVSVEHGLASCTANMAPYRIHRTTLHASLLFARVGATPQGSGRSGIAVVIVVAGDTLVPRRPREVSLYEHFYSPDSPFGTSSNSSNTSIACLTCISSTAGSTPI
jgi:hypothetical protein